MTALQIGDRVRCTHPDDRQFVAAGQTGQVVYVVPTRYGQPTEARILWDNDTSCLLEQNRFAVIQKRRAVAA